LIKVFLKTIYLLLGLIILINITACNTTKQTNQVAKDDNKSSTDYSYPYTNGNSNDESNSIVNKDINNQETNINVNTESNPSKTTIAKQGSYTSEKGITISIPLEWDNKAKIKEDNTSITLIYTGIPNHNLEIFSIGCYSQDKFKNLILSKQDAEVYNSAKFGQSSKYVFCLFTPITIDLSKEEIEKYIKELNDINLPIEKIKEIIKVN
jgi:hypothetical protein